MKAFRIILLLLAVFSFTSCITVRTERDYDRELDYTQFKSFYLISAPGEWGDIDSLYAYEQLAKALKEDGLVEKVDADLLIQMYAEEYISVEDNAAATIGLGMGGGNFGGFAAAGIPLQKERLNRIYRLGFLKAEGAELIYETYIQLIGDPDFPPQKYDQALIKGFKKMLEDYPPENENTPPKESSEEQKQTI